MVPDKVYVVYIQQPQPLAGISRLEVFADRGRAVACLRDAYDRFLSSVPDASVREFALDAGDAVAAGVIRTAFTSWSGRVIARDLA